MEAGGVEEREGKLRCAAETEEDLHEEALGEGHAPAGQKLERRLGRMEGVVVREE